MGWGNPGTSLESSLWRAHVLFGNYVLQLRRLVLLFLERHPRCHGMCSRVFGCIGSPTSQMGSSDRHCFRQGTTHGDHRLSSSSSQFDSLRSVHSKLGKTLDSTRSTMKSSKLVAAPCLSYRTECKTKLVRDECGQLSGKEATWFPCSRVKAHNSAATITEDTTLGESRLDGLCWADQRQNRPFVQHHYISFTVRRLSWSWC